MLDRLVSNEVVNQTKHPIRNKAIDLLRYLSDLSQISGEHKSVRRACSSANNELRRASSPVFLVVLQPADGITWVQ